MEYHCLPIYSVLVSSDTKEDSRKEKESRLREWIRANRPMKQKEFNVTSDKLPYFGRYCGTFLPEKVCTWLFWIAQFFGDAWRPRNRVGTPPDTTKGKHSLRGIGKQFEKVLQATNARFDATGGVWMADEHHLVVSRFYFKPVSLLSGKVTYHIQ